MTETTIDSIVRDSLASNGMTLHYYVQALQMALRCLRDINLNHHGAIGTVELVVDANNMVRLPDGYIDYIKIGHRRGRYVVPMAQNSSYNRLPSIISGAEAPYESYGVSGVFDPYSTSARSAYGEQLGRIYGMGDGTRTDVFKVIPERGVALIGEYIAVGETIVLEYIYQPDYANAMAFVPAYAEESIKTYISMSFARMYGRRLGEIERLNRDYQNAVRRMRAATYALTKEDLLGLERRNIKLSIKG